MCATRAQRVPTRGVWGHAPPEKIWIFRPSKNVSDGIFGVKEQELPHACLALKTYTRKIVRRGTIIRSRRDQSRE